MNAVRNLEGPGSFWAVAALGILSRAIARSGLLLAALLLLKDRVVIIGPNNPHRTRRTARLQWNVQPTRIQSASAIRDSLRIFQPRWPHLRQRNGGCVAGNQGRWIRPIDWFAGERGFAWLPAD